MLVPLDDEFWSGNVAFASSLCGRDNSVKTKSEAAGLEGSLPHFGMLIRPLLQNREPKNVQVLKKKVDFTRNVLLCCAIAPDSAKRKQSNGRIFAEQRGEVENRSSRLPKQ